MSEKFVVRVVVGGVGYEGPDLWFVKVVCNQEQLDNGDHYEAAKNWVGENILNADDINWACDDKDPCKAILSCFEWDTAKFVKI